MEKTILPVSVLIPTLNRPDTLKQTLDSYFAADFLPSQMVVVDQSQDTAVAAQIRDLVESYCQGTQMTYVYQQMPSSTMARNTALPYAREEIIIYSDDDIDIYPNTIAQVHAVMQNSEIAMIAGINDNAGTSQTNIGYLLGTKSYRNRHIGHVTASMLGRYPDNVRGQVDTQWAMGYFFTVRKSCMDRWGLKWDEKMTGYAYAEDLDFSYSYYRKAKAEGLRCILDERIHVLHRYSQEYRIPSRKHTFVYVANRAYLSAKHRMGAGSELAMAWCNFWRLAERIARREKPTDMARSMLYCMTHRRAIRGGDLKYPFE